ncbi:IPTL-CTERM sorting domain-containing protein [Ottowia sp. SB7-C50]|uniref:IPTL-CTERM sorting domain-containing protein n=1 Tax=Ottowia sp. SB7-C50 TaxID=3081231 RepID=UPI0029553F66|nr:IPTL-CTERM sorting domain-containing protein [Ottowia sp. SB7-C50]WOP14812.1 IPTL-CTERM sorting domain-containing protein [Ottowia sp. SB7-C50]
MAGNVVTALLRAWAKLAVAVAMLLSLSAVQHAHAANCKVLFHGSVGYVSAQALVLDGYDVVATETLTGLSGYLSGPNANLGQYCLIWLHWVNHYTPTAADGDAIKTYLAGGGSVHFSGEYPEGQMSMSAAYTAWMLDIMNTRLLPASGGGSVTYSTSMQGGTWELNPASIASVHAVPFPLGSPQPSQIGFDNGGGLLGNIPARNRVAYQGDLASMSGVTNTAAFDEADMVGGKGRISFFGDVGNLGPSTQTSQNIQLIKNLQNFLSASGPSSCPANLLAVDDSGSVFATGGQAIANVLSNDDMNPGGLHGQVVPQLGTFVTVSEVPGSNTSPAGFVITLDTATGAVNVPANTPPGTYSLDYKICQISHPTNCATAKATVTVKGPPPAAISLTQAVNSHPVGATHQAQATVTDANGKPVPNVDVTLTLASGPNVDNVYLVVKTDSNGVAVFSYPGVGGLGMDVLQATVDSGNGSLPSNTLEVKWTQPRAQEPQAPVAVPTLSGWSLLLLALTAGVTGWRRQRR